MRASVLLAVLCALALSALVFAEEWPAGHESMADIQARIEKMREEQNRVRQEIEEMLAQRRKEHEERLAEIRAQHNIPSHRDTSSYTTGSGNSGRGDTQVFTDADFESGDLSDNNNINIVRGGSGGALPGRRGARDVPELGGRSRRPAFTPPSAAARGSAAEGEDARDDVHAIVQEEIARMRAGEITSEELSVRIEERLKAQRDADRRTNLPGARPGRPPRNLADRENDMESLRARRGGAAREEALARAQEAMNRARQMREEREQQEF